MTNNIQLTKVINETQETYEEMIKRHIDKADASTKNCTPDVVVICGLADGINFYSGLYEEKDFYKMIGMLESIKHHMLANSQQNEE